MFHCGEPRAAYELTVGGLATYDALPAQTAFDQYGQNPMVPMLCTQAIALWLLGYPDQARRRSQAAVQLATDQIAPFGIVVARGFFMMMQQCVRAGMVEHGWAEHTILLASEYGSHVWEGIGQILWGWTLVEHGQREVGWAQLHQGESRLRIGEGETFQSYVLWLLADAYGRSQQVVTALITVSDALTLVEKSGERFWEAELYRLRGELTLAVAREEKSQKANLTSSP
ncbi:MAG: hypothetical protein HOP18_12500 [Deltaproteobacteria bacterium]|nr:hypothetical protein [Deltaproteobacteria bacterium]